MRLSELLHKNVVFISGKGGVGKTTVSLLLAWIAVSQGRRPILVELNSSGRIPALFNKKNESYREITLTKDLSTINVTPRACFEEYVSLQLPFPKLYGPFLRNRHVTNFIEGIPGLGEVLMLGKIWLMEAQIRKKEVDYDMIIVDAPATGHGLSLLEVPSVLLSAAKTGPLNKHARGILNLLNDQQRTVISLVTLAEEMPVNESEEYLEALRERTELAVGPLFVNAVMPEVPAIKKPSGLEGDEKLLWDYYRLSRCRHELNEEYVKIIGKRFAGIERVVIPFDFSGLNTPETIQARAKSLSEELL